MTRFNTDVENYEVRVIRKRGKLEIVDVTHWSRMKHGVQDGDTLKTRVRRSLVAELALSCLTELNLKRLNAPINKGYGETTLVKLVEELRNNIRDERRTPRNP